MHESSLPHQVVHNMLTNFNAYVANNAYLHGYERPIIQSSVNGEYDMKVVWVANNCDVLDGNVRSVTLGNMK